MWFNKDGHFDKLARATVVHQIKGESAMSVPIETEAKFLCPAGLTAADVSAVLERLGLTVRWYEPQTQTDTYFDTKRGVLQAANASLRLRRIGHTHIGTLKLPKSHSGAVMERQEIEWTLSPEDVQSWTGGTPDLSGVPGDVTAKLQQYGVQCLAAVLTVVTVRHPGNVTGLNGFLAEVGLDKTTFTGSRGQAMQTELELELKAGHADRLQEVTEALCRQLGIEPSTQSKFAAGMEQVG
jgi:inorganic triphosphatase YgiF